MRTTPSSAAVRTLSTEKCLEPRIRAQRIKIGIFRRPIFVKNSVLHYLLQAIKGVFGAAQKGVDACNIVENGSFFGIDCQCPASPVKTLHMVSDAWRAFPLPGRAPGDRRGDDRCASRSIATRVAESHVASRRPSQSVVDGHQQAYRLVVIGVELGRLFVEFRGFCSNRLAGTWCAHRNNKPRRVWDRAGWPLRIPFAPDRSSV